jgi:N-acetylmuramoyl-L-alanine amidase
VGVGVAFFLAVTLFSNNLFAGEVVRREIEPGVYVSVKNARTLGLEVRMPAGNSAKGLLSKYLTNESDWVMYKNRLNCFVPYSSLKQPYKRKALLTLYRDDYIDDEGWHHTALMDGETLWTLSEWIVGNGRQYSLVLADKRNRTATTLAKGNTILIPKKLLSKVMAQTTPHRFRVTAPELAPLQKGFVFNTDRSGTYAQYTMKRGETLYSSIVTRFTTYKDPTDILKACNEIARRSGISDVTDIDHGRKIKIPVYMLSDAWQPKGSTGRVAHEESLKESERLKTAKVYSRDLSDVVIILDPGHGGADRGAQHSGSRLYEDEINFDIVCRIKQLLERDTDAKVILTLQDGSNKKYKPNNATRFGVDSNEYLLTNPIHKNLDADVSADLRWMLVNSHYDQEIKQGVDPRKIIFTSVHTNSISNPSFRGALVYIPGARYRRAQEMRRDKLFQRYYEGQNFNRFASTASERKRDEALSRNFADVLLDEMSAKRIKRHNKSDSIRTNIRKSKNKVFVPAVLRNTKVPTKILIETANLQNPVDRSRLSDSWWRQQFAEAYVDALKTHFEPTGKQNLAFAD